MIRGATVFAIYIHKGVLQKKGMKAMNVDVYLYLRVRQREVAPTKLHRSTDKIKPAIYSN